MSKAEFTPGPWSASYDTEPSTRHGLPFWEITGGSGFWRDGFCINNIMRRDDAYLIAAAPEMYDLLASIENDAGQVPQWLWDRIQTTLAKARGEEA